MACCCCPCVAGQSIGCWDGLGDASSFGQGDSSDIVNDGLLQVMVNQYSVHMDPDDWQQPQQFRPERFLDESGNVVGRERIMPFSLGTSSI